MSSHTLRAVLERSAQWTAKIRAKIHRKRNSTNRIGLASSAAAINMVAIKDVRVERGRFGEYRVRRPRGLHARCHCGVRAQKVRGTSPDWRNRAAMAHSHWAWD